MKKNWSADSLLLKSATFLLRVDDCQSPVPAEWPHPSGVQRVILRFVCLRQHHGILAPKDIKGAFRYEVRHAKIRGPG